MPYLLTDDGYHFIVAALEAARDGFWQDSNLGEALIRLRRTGWIPNDDSKLGPLP